MRIRTAILAVIMLVVLLACNLTNTPPTPTLRPVTPSLPTQSSPPTLFASITPLTGSGGVFVTQTPTPLSGCVVPVGWIQYVVETGDSLGDLANATGTTIEQLVAANCLADADTLFTGQTIYLPRSPISG